MSPFECSRVLPWALPPLLLLPPPPPPPYFILHPPPSLTLTLALPLPLLGGSYFKTPIRKIVRGRAWWLISLLMLQSVSSVILTRYSNLIEVGSSSSSSSSSGGGGDGGGGSHEDKHNER